MLDFLKNIFWPRWVLFAARGIFDLCFSVQNL